MYLLAIISVLVLPVQCVFRNAIVHFDLKGAPPRVSYFKQLLTTVGNLGATGVLIEWEDMFPFKGELSRVVNGNAYSEEDVIDILQHASLLGLDVIPLVQTLAHMEWILKTDEYSQLREDQNYPMVACIGDQRAGKLILDAVTQIVSMHAKFSTKYVHIGADEAFQIGICDADKEILPIKYGNDTLRMIFDHLSTIADNVTREYPGVKVLMWYDELQNAPAELIQEYYLNNLVVPVVWKYTSNLEKDLPTQMWKNLSYNFRDVWGARADGSSRYWNRMKPYLLNNKAWHQQNEKYSQLFDNFDSIIITGWQRYDHFASLCELWPTSMASLALNLIVLSKNHIDPQTADLALRSLNCPVATTIDNLLAGSDKCRYPGYRVRDSIRDFVQLKSFFDNSTWVHNRENGWLQPSHIRITASNPYYIDAIGQAYGRTIKKLDNIIKALRTSLNELFFDDVADEFLTDVIMPFYEDLQRRLKSVNEINNRKTYQPRPWFGSRAGRLL
ncbi:unnamed protein product [Caenorhabditis bovis]|uniref:beta-N-acetylhexosaminidase n=1 Tax=Caenorhabditis bovis TaxID=2654633 RepID=A0A8S1E6E4_9PELO|nr:unnamed protein product [Caenorhabditis bovis]